MNSLIELLVAVTWLYVTFSNISWNILVQNSKFGPCCRALMPWQLWHPDARRLLYPTYHLKNSHTWISNQRPSDYKSVMLTVAPWWAFNSFKSLLWSIWSKILWPADWQTDEQIRYTFITWNTLYPCSLKHKAISYLYFMTTCYITICACKKRLFRVGKILLSSCDVQEDGIKQQIFFYYTKRCSSWFFLFSTTMNCALLCTVIMLHHPNLFSKHKSDIHVIRS